MQPNLFSKGTCTHARTELRAWGCRESVCGANKPARYFSIFDTKACKNVVSSDTIKFCVLAVKEPSSSPHMNCKKDIN